MPEPEPAASAPADVRPVPITTLLIAANIAIFAVELAIARDPMDAVFFTKRSASIAIMATGGNYWLATVHESRWETLLTSCFVHGGLLHLIFNMVAMRQIGPIVERIVGPARMLPLYLIAGFVGSFLSTFVHVMRGSDSVGVGASGAICGLIAAALVIGYRVEGRDSPMLKVMARWLLTILAIGLVPGIDGMAHGGGMIAGGVIAFLWRRGFTYSAARRTLVLGACVLVVCLTGARVAYFDLTDAYAKYTLDDRTFIAEKALENGDCALARSAIAAAKRLAPDTPKTVHVAERVIELCP